MSAGMIPNAPMVEELSDSLRTERPMHLHGCRGAEKGANLLAVKMMSEHVDV